jgi:hypothetical protein
MTKAKHVFITDNLMEIISKHKKYKQLMDRFVLRHREYTYEIVVTPGDCFHTMIVNVK